MTTAKCDFDTDCASAQTPMPMPLGYVWPSFPRHLLFQAPNYEFANVVAKKCFCTPLDTVCLCAITPLPQPSGYERRGFPQVAPVLDAHTADSPDTDSEEHVRFSFPRFAHVPDAHTADSPDVVEGLTNLSFGQASCSSCCQPQPFVDERPLSMEDDTLRSKALEIMEGWDTCELWKALQNPEAVKAILSQKVITRKEERLLLAQLAATPSTLPTKVEPPSCAS